MCPGCRRILCFLSYSTEHLQLVWIKSLGQNLLGVLP